MRRERFGGLDVVIGGGNDLRGGGTGPLVVLLHGFGAPAEDLVPLAWNLDVPSGTRFVCPAAPIALGLPFADVRAWWQIDVARVARGDTSMTQEVPRGLAEARALVLELLDLCATRLGAAPERTVLGGFSQGAMLSTDVVLRSTRPFAGLMLFSGAVICESEWAPCFAVRRSLPIFQCHGDADPLLPYSGALRLRALWESSGAEVTFVSFAGGHEIPPTTIHGASEFLGRVLG